MARLIQDTPLLTGKQAKDFIKQNKRIQKIGKDKIYYMFENYNKINVVDPEIKANMTSSEMTKVLTNRLIEIIKNHLKL